MFTNPGIDLRFNRGMDQDSPSRRKHAFFEPAGETQTKVQANSPSICVHLDYSGSQIPSFADDVHKDPDYPIES